MKKPTRRSQVKYPALRKKYNSRIKQEKIDFDYLDKLSTEDITWLAKFMEEEMNGRFQNDGTDFNQSKEQRKKIYDRINQANRCLYGNLKNKADRSNNKNLLNYDDIVSDVELALHKDLDPKMIENAYIDFLDSKEVQAMLAEYDKTMSEFIEERE